MTQAYIDQQDIGWHICNTCRRSPWDCSCPVSVECSYCGVEQLDEKADPHRCDDSPDGLHHFASADKDP